MRADKLSSDDLMVLLDVARTGRYVGAADRLGLNHTTIARRIENLENALGGRVLTRGAVGWELTPLDRQAFAAGGGHHRRGADVGDRRFLRLHRRAGGGRRSA